MNGPAETRAPAYLEALVRHVHEIGIKGPGVHHVEVRHDPDCALLVKGGVCDCNPEIASGKLVNEKYEDGGHG